MPKPIEPTHRLRSNFLLVIFDGISRILSVPLFMPLHEVVRVSHSVFTRPFLEVGLRARYRFVRGVCLRHSQTRFGRFHLLLSDVDITVRVAATASQDDLESLRGTYERLRRWLVFLGEIEIYTEAEFAAKSAWEKTYPEILDLVRLTRKFSWIEGERQKNRPYHGLKARRSFARNQNQFRSLIQSPAVEIIARSFARDSKLQISVDLEREARAYFGKGFDLLPEPLQECLAFLSPGALLIEDQPQLPSSLRFLRWGIAQTEMISSRARTRILNPRKKPEEVDHLLRWSARLEQSLDGEIRSLSQDQRVLDIQVYEVLLRVFLEGSDDLNQRAYEAVSLEFDYFKAKVELSASPRILVRVGPARPPSASKPFFLKAGIGKVGRAKNLRTVQCPRGSRLEFVPRKWISELRFWGTESAESSVLTNAVEAVLGECLERHGYLRLHAAAREESGKAIVVSAPSGGGKSTSTARRLLSKTEKVYSDEITWVKNQIVYPFPTPVALHPEPIDIAFSQEIMRHWTGLTRTFVGSTKRLFPIPAERVAAPAPLGKIIAIESGHGRALKWILRIVSGQGLPQMWPYLIRRENLFWLPRLALRRFIFGLRLCAYRKVELAAQADYRVLENRAFNDH